MEVPMRTNDTNELLATEFAKISHGYIAGLIREGQRLRAEWLAAFARSAAGKVRALARRR
jgi:hypothetical protein